jgi:hypothetical protein
MPEAGHWFRRRVLTDEPPFQHLRHRSRRRRLAAKRESPTADDTKTHSMKVVR